MHIQVCHTSSHTTVCKQEVHFKKRLKTFKPLGSANGDGAGEGKNSRKDEICKRGSGDFLEKF